MSGCQRSDVRCQAKRLIIFLDPLTSDLDPYWCHRMVKDAICWLWSFAAGRFRANTLGPDITVWSNSTRR